MAFSFKNNSRNKKKAAISDINITPFVDVLLVLLIIFMVAAPMMTGSVNVDLPKGASEAISEKNQPIIITIKSDGEIYLQDEQIKLGNLNQQLRNSTNNNFESKIYIKADQAIDYGRVMDVIKNINLGGFKQVILMTEIG